MTDQFVAVGDNCLDVYVNRDQYAVGGNALNVAADWRRAGISARYIGAVGTDATADLLIEGMRGAKLDSLGLQRLDGATGVTFLRLDDGERHILHEEFGVGLDLRMSEAEVAELAQSAWVHLQGTAPEARLVERFVACGARVSVDLSTYHGREALGGVEVAFASMAPGPDDDAWELAAQMVDAGAQRAVILRGPSGSVSWDGSSRVEQAAEPIVPIDTCGAGDSYIAGFVASVVAGKSIDHAMLEATRSASRTCLHLGGFDQPMRTTPDWLNDHARAVGARR
jgi:fructoselysine 6-kinase